jgi:hypothetical protein
MSLISVQQDDNDGCGGDDALVIPRGQCLDLSIKWGGLDATGMIISVLEASHPILMELVITPVAPVTAEYKIYLSPTGTAQLPDGRLSWFRLEIRPDDAGPNRVTPKIWIDIQ